MLDSAFSLDAALSLTGWGGGELRFDFFVDPAGNDTNSGTSADEPFATLAAVEPLLTQGKRVKLSAGTWRERLVITADDVVVVGEGDGTLIACDDVIPNGSITKTAGRTNIYQMTLAVETDVNAAEWPGLWENSVRFKVKAADLTALDATPGAIWYDTVADTTPITLYFHPPGSTDPTTNGKTYEAAVRASGIDTYDAERCTIQSMRGRRNYGSYGSFTLGRYCVGRNLRASEGNSHNIFKRAFSSTYDCWCDDAWADGVTSPTMFINFELNAPAGAYVRSVRDRVTSTVYDVNLIGSYTHTAGTTSFDEITYEDFESDNVANPLQGADTLLTTVTNDQHTNFLTAYKFRGALNVSGSTYADVKVGGRLAVTDANGVTQSFNDIDGTFNTTAAIRVAHDNCTISLTNSRTFGMNSVIDGTGADNLTFVHTGNTHYPNGRMFTGFSLPGTGLSLTSNNNAWKGMTGNFVIGGTTYNTFALYQAGTGQDANSTNAVDPPPDISILSGLFTGALDGMEYVINDLATVNSDLVGTPAGIGDAVAQVLDKAGRGYHWQPAGTTKPTLQQDGSGNYYLQFDSSDDFAASIKTLTAGLPAFIACVVSKGSEAALGIFGLAKDGANYIRIGNIASSSRIAAQIRSTARGVITLNSNTSLAPINTVMLADALFTNGQQDLFINGASAATPSSNTWISGDVVTGMAAGVNLNAAVSGTAQSLRFYGGVILLADPGANRAEARTRLADACGYAL